jgi:hypothetical protein
MRQGYCLAVAVVDGQSLIREVKRPYRYAVIANGYLNEDRREDWHEWRALNWCVRPDLAEKRQRQRQEQGYVNVRVVPVDLHG